MDFIVYSYGGAEALWKVFNSLAMLSKSSYFYNLSILMTGAALLTVAARALPAASIPFLFKRWILPTFFLMAFFWGPKVTVNLVDHVDTNFNAAPIENVPFGVAFAASLTTRMSDRLTEIVEQYMTSSDMQRYSKVGPMFGARLMYEARTITIKDPLMRENIKDFTRQCFAWPYVFTNIAPGKKAALETEDMLGFIEENAHKSLGIYWRNPNGESEFMFCNRCAAKVREVLPLEVETGFKALAGKLFGTTADGASETRRLRQYFGDAWQYLAKGSSNAANIIQQELMINSYRAAMQEKREEFGLARDPALSYLNAERGQMQQDESSLIKLALFGTQIPMWHSIFLSMGLLFFTIIAPFTFMEGGISLIKSFAKFMMWLASWPPLSSMINALGHMYLAKATSGQMLGYGDGLSLMTQNGLSDTAYHAYAFVMGLQLSIPALSWALLNQGGGYAMSQLSSYITQAGDSFASRAGSEVVDGNVSFDSQTLHHRSVASTQLAQQQLSPNMNYGSRFDDGKLAKLYGPTPEGQLDRHETHQQHQANMGTNLVQNDAASMMLSAQGQTSYMSGINSSKSAAKQVQLGNNETYGLLKHVSENKGITDTFGGSISSQAQKNISESMDFVRQVAKEHNISDEKSFEMLAGVSASLGFAKGTGFGASLNANFNGNFKASARDVESLSEHIKSGKVQQFAENLSSTIQHLQDNKGSISDSLTRQKMHQAQDHFNKADVYMEQAQASFGESKNFTKMAATQRQRGVSSSSNLTDRAIQALADDKYGGDRHRAAQEASLKPELLEKASARQIDLSALKYTPSESEQSIRADYGSRKQSIKDMPNENPEIAYRKREIDKKAGDLEKEVKDVQRNNSYEIIQTRSKFAPQKKELDNRYQDINGELKKEGGKYLINKAWDKAWKWD